MNLIILIIINGGVKKSMYTYLLKIIKCLNRGRIGYFWPTEKLYGQIENRTSIRPCIPIQP